MIMIISGFLIIAFFMYILIKRKYKYKIEVYMYSIILVIMIYNTIDKLFDYING